MVRAERNDLKDFQGHVECDCFMSVLDSIVLMEVKCNYVQGRIMPFSETADEETKRRVWGGSLEAAVHGIQQINKANCIKFN